jgi:hypothetical protein
MLGVKELLRTASVGWAHRFIYNDLQGRNQKEAVQHIAEQGIAARKAWSLAARPDPIGASPPAGEGSRPENVPGLSLLLRTWRTSIPLQGSMKMPLCLPRACCSY